MEYSAALDDLFDGSENSIPETNDPLHSAISFILYRNRVPPPYDGIVSELIFSLKWFLEERNLSSVSAKLTRAAVGIALAMKEGFQIDDDIAADVKFLHDTARRQIDQVHSENAAYYRGEEKVPEDEASDSE
jgi:hypothetical protein